MKKPGFISNIDIPSFDSLTEKNKKIIIASIGIVVFLISYFLIYMNLTGKTEEMDAEIAALQPRVVQLQEYYDNLAAYEDGIKKSANTVREKMIHYPNAVRPEDKTMYAVALEHETGMNITSVNFGEDIAIMDIMGVIEEEGNLTSDESDNVTKYSLVTMSAISSSMTITGDMNYWGLKSALNYIYNTSERSRVNSVGISYDSSTGRLNGNMVIDKYYIRGFDNKYYPTVIPNMNMGTIDIFNSVG